MLKNQKHSKNYKHMYNEKKCFLLYSLKYVRKTSLS